MAGRARLSNAWLGFPANGGTIAMAGMDFLGYRDRNGVIGVMEC